MADRTLPLAGKVALITGAAGGIGMAICRTMRDAGAKIIAADLNLDGVECDHGIAGDLANDAYCDGLASQAAAAFGGLDILVNNAGIMRRGPITDASDEDFTLSMKINVEAPFRICRASIPIMAASGGGAIVNTASCWGVYPGSDHLVYCTTKAAIASMTQCLGRDHAHQNIRVNAVCPNEVDTPMLRTGFAMRGYDPKTAIAALGETVPIGHVAAPDEIADVVLFLASDTARYICGALVEVNGGKPVG